jgi:hypothetical protein
MKCKYCTEEFDEKVSIEMYGKFPADAGFCSPTCWTKYRMDRKNTKKD